MADSDEIVGKWRVTAVGKGQDKRRYVWEYTFEPNGVVRWRDPFNNQSGAGKWSPTPKTIFISWAPKSATKEHWYRPISPKFQTGDYQASYGPFTVVAERISRGDDQPYFIKPAWSSSFTGVTLDGKKHLFRQEMALGAREPVALANWRGCQVSVNDPSVAAISIFEDKANDLLAIDIVGTAHGDANLEAFKNGKCVVHMQIHVTNVPSQKAPYVDDFIEGYYHPDYKHQGGNYSKYVILRYVDDVAIPLHIDEISDTTVDPATAARQISAGSVRDGGRRFPQKMNASTTPRLVVLKRQALEVMAQYFREFMMISFQAVIFILGMVPPGASAIFRGVIGPPRRVPRTTVPRSVQRTVEAGAAPIQASARPRATIQQLRQMLANASEYFCWRTNDAELAANGRIKFTGQTNPTAPQGVYLGKGLKGFSYGEYTVAVKGSDYPNYRIKLSGTPGEYILPEEIPANKGVWYTQGDLAKAQALGPLW